MRRPMDGSPLLPNSFWLQTWFFTKLAFHRLAPIPIAQKTYSKKLYNHHTLQSFGGRWLLLKHRWSFCFLDSRLEYHTPSLPWSYGTDLEKNTIGKTSLDTSTFIGLAAGHGLFSSVCVELSAVSWLHSPCSTGPYTCILYRHLQVRHLQRLKNMFMRTRCYKIKRYKSPKQETP